MKFVSIDIETTGLDPKKHQILEVGACIVDTQTPSASVDWPKFRMLLTQEDYTVTPYCAKLHYDLWQELSAIKNPKEITVKQDCMLFSGHCLDSDFPLVFMGWCKRNGVDKIIPAGKNFGSFDLQFLNRLPNWNAFVRMAHRTYDPAAYYFMRNDAILPDMNLCCQRAGIAAQTDHTALADAILVAQLCLKGLER